MPRGPGSLPKLQVELLHELQVTGGVQVVLPQASPRTDLIPLFHRALANLALGSTESASSITVQNV